MKDTLQILIRLGVKALAGYLVAHALADDATATKLANFAGAGVLALIGFGWSKLHLAFAKGQGQAQPIPVKTVAVAFALLTCLGFSGCATSPSKSHIVHIAGVGTKGGIVQDPVTGMYSLGLQRVQADLLTIPIMFSTNKDGTIVVILPDVVASYEVSSHSPIFGNVGATMTMATGTNAVWTVLGGQHQPINEGVGTGSNINPQVPK